MSNQTEIVDVTAGFNPVDDYAENASINTSSADFVAGFALALAELLRNGAHPTAAEATVGAAGLSLDDFRTAGVAEFDWDTISGHKSDLWPDEFPSEDFPVENE